MRRQNPATPGPTTPPGPRQDRPAAATPARIAALLHVVRTLLAYGRHLADTIAARAATPGFTPIAACFGTTNLSVILTHLHRGILRATALERVLLARAARGRDIAFAAPRIRPQNRQPAPRPARPTPRHQPTEFHTPTLQELHAQVRRRPLGRTIADICLDLAVVPGFCTGTFWNQLFDIMQCHGGSVANLMRERFRREQAFRRQQDRTPTQDSDWSHLRRQMVRQVLGFFIGEQPLLPSHPPTPGAPPTAVAPMPPHHHPP